MDQFHKSQNAHVPYPTMLHSEQKYAHSVLNGALWDMEQMHYGICELGHLQVVSVRSWRFQCNDRTMMTSSNWNIFRVILTLCAGNSPVTGEFPSQRPVTRSFDVFFDLRLNKRMSKQSWGWWFETPSCSLWRHCNDAVNTQEDHNDAVLLATKI